MTTSWNFSFLRVNACDIERVNVFPNAESNLNFLTRENFELYRTGCRFWSYAWATRDRDGGSALIPAQGTPLYDPVADRTVYSGEWFVCVDARACRGRLVAPSYYTWHRQQWDAHQSVGSMPGRTPVHDQCRHAESRGRIGLAAQGSAALYCL